MRCDSEDQICELASRSAHRHGFDTCVWSCGRTVTTATWIFHRLPCNRDLTNARSVRTASSTNCKTFRPNSVRVHAAANLPAKEWQSGLSAAKWPPATVDLPLIFWRSAGCRNTSRTSHVATGSVVDEALGVHSARTLEPFHFSCILSLSRRVIETLKKSPHEFGLLHRSRLFALWAV